MPNPYPTPPPTEVAQGLRGGQACLLGRDSLEKLYQSLPGAMECKGKALECAVPP